MKKFTLEVIAKIANGDLKADEQSKQVIINKLIKTIVKSAKHFKEQFPEFPEEVNLDVTADDIDAILNYKHVQQTRFSADLSFSKKIFRSVTKLLVLVINPPKPFKKQGITPESVADAITKLGNQLTLNLDILTVLASQHESIFEKMKAEGLVHLIVDRLLNSGPMVKETGLSEASVYSLLSQCLYHLSSQPLFLEQYSDSLPLQLYSKTIKAQVEGGTKIALNSGLTKDSIELLLESIKKMVMEGDDKAARKRRVAEISAQLKQDLSDPTKVDDVAFIQQVVVVLLHAEVPVSISFSVDMPEGSLPITDSNLFMSLMGGNHKEFFLDT